MTNLYNCHTDGDQYRITKFDSLGNVESTYLCTIDECECPAGFRPSCRHRHMLPRFIAKGAVNTFYFYDYDRQGWVTNEPAPMNGQVITPSERTVDDVAVQMFATDITPTEPIPFRRRI